MMAASIEMDLGEWGKCRVLSMDGLLSAKRAAGRDKDKPTIAELEIIRKFLQDKPPSDQKS